VPIIDNLPGVTIRDLKTQYAHQLPTVAALIYAAHIRAGLEPDPDEAAEEAVELVDALLATLIEEEAKTTS